ncbi:MAG: UPF0182 family protein [bacterium]
MRELPATSSKKPWALIVFGIVLVFFVFGSTFVQIYTNWMWYAHDVRRPEIFKTLYITRFWLFLAGFVLSALFASFNWVPAIRATLILGVGTSDLEMIVMQVFGWLQRGVLRLVMIIAPIIGLFYGAFAASGWQDFLLYQNAITIGKTDPVFHQDLGFYLFKLSFLQFAAQYLLWMVIFIGGITAAIYFINRLTGMIGSVSVRTPVMRTHLLILIALFFVLVAWNMSLGRFNYLFSANAVLTGVSYSDAHARIPLINGLVWGALILAVLSLLNIRAGRAFTPVIAGAIVWAIVGFVGMYLYAGVIVEKFSVVPNQSKLESQYIARNINATRAAYALDKIEVRDITYTEEPSSAELNASQTTLENMRVWDPRVLSDAYNNLQALWPYYRFNQEPTGDEAVNSIDVDRYIINGKQRVTMLAARELYTEGLPASSKTWIALHLQYTHGYGIVMNQVNAATPEGAPLFITQNIPPQSPPNLTLKEPGIYYGESDSGPIYANSSIPENDYPMGAAQKTTHYRGTNGIPIGGSHWFTRMMFAFRFGDSNLMLTKEITPQTKLLYQRAISARAQAVFPFLKLDPDPYIVNADGKLYWMLDAYTTSNKYPYSSLYGAWGLDLNYVRNSIKIVIDAYDGTVTGYISDTDDPVLKVYQRIFPNLFKPLDQMPPTLKRHIRYPEGLFRIQSGMYRFYHMTDPQVFYQKSDAWEIPNENLEVGKKIQMSPYYVQMRLPDAPTDAFQLILPFTAYQRQNLIGWMSAQCDPENYGRLVVYRFPDQVTVPGPETVYSFFQQNPEISPQMTLWNSAQGGSQALFGNLLVIPIGKSLIYVQPVFLRATTQDTGGSIPELRAVMVGAGRRTTIAPTFEEALKKLFVGQKVPQTVTLTPSGKPQPQQKPNTVINLVNEANIAYEAALNAQKQGNWAEYGKQQQRLGETIKKLKQTSGQ